MISRANANLDYTTLTWRHGAPAGSVRILLASVGVLREYITLLAGISWPADWVQSRQAFLQAWQSGKRSMWLGLIPIRHRKIIIGAHVCVSVLDRRAQRFRKCDRRIQVESIDRRPTASAFFAFQRR